jgi:beta-N-acetylhexosaminidase
MTARARMAHLAGCDVLLHCNGDMMEMTAIAAGSRPLRGRPAARASAALARLPGAPEPLDLAEARDRLSRLLGGAPS